MADREPPLYAIIDAAGLSHSKGMKSYLIMMAVRLMEMKRLLKDTGSIYLHCDPTASHYLKTLMDAIFGKNNFRNEITWRRTTAKGLASRGYPNSADNILYYSTTKAFLWNGAYQPLDEDYIAKSYRHMEPETGRKYTLGDLVNPNTDRPNLTYEFMGVTRVWRWTRDRMQNAFVQGLIVQKAPGAIPRFKRYLDESKGRAVDTIWDDLPALKAKATERLGYPTQKPLALLNRIIKASSNEGDTIFDPFCGCATACVAAEHLQRHWVGIDLSPLAAKLVNSRLHKDMGLFFDIHHRTDIPHRTDLGELPSYRTHKHMLYGKQEGVCVGCLVMFPFRNFTIDHIVAQSKGGSDHLDNLQLLCGACNSMKGARSQEEFVAALVKHGMR